MMRSHLSKALLSLSLSGALAAAAHAGEINIVNLDAGTKQGLDDPTPASPVGGNPGITRGQQALTVFRFAADLWGSVLQSNVPVINTATFKPLSCDATSGVLGSSGTNYIFAFNSPAPAGAVPKVWYHSALADALSGTDAAIGEGMAADTPDIVSQFNGKLGTTGCLESSGWYFGLDGKTPAGQINLLNVVLHEMAHGLGFSGFNALSTGAQLQDQPDIYSTFVKNNVTGKAWTAMSDAERKNSALDDGHLAFTGSNVKAEAPLALTPMITLNVSTPAAITGSYDYNEASFGSKPSPSNFSGSVVRPADPTACNGVDAGVSGKIALIDRGTCAFAVKTKAAQVAGAKAVIIANNQAGGIAPSGSDATITIPTIAVSQTIGDMFKANLAGLVVSLAPDAQRRLSGGDAEGNVLLYAPTVLAQGSSFSHYDTRLKPDAIMEYAITPDLVGQVDLDLTPALLKDEGWKLNEGSQKLLTCDTGVATWLPGGTIVGANIVSSLKVQASAAADLAAYRAAALNYASQLASSGLITAKQAASLNACLSDAELQKQLSAWGSGGVTPPTDTSIALQNGVALNDQQGTIGSEAFYKIDVPANTKVLVLRTAGGSGDVSLYVKAGAKPTATSFDSSSIHPGNAESVTVTRIGVATTYYLRVVGVKAYTGVMVQATFIP
jgi:hypothetical protein